MNEIDKPEVTVLMSVYNGEAYLSKALDSIITQSFKDFEFLIIDDGSNDNSPKILKQYAAKDKRLKVITQKNSGLVASLNRGIEIAKGKYIARQDADDISDHKRLEKQLKFLEDDPKIVAAGSSIAVMNAHGKIMHRHAVLLNDPELRQELLVRSPFAHGSVMFECQAAIKAGLYHPASWPAEDYDFWLRLSRYGKLANIDEYLYIYREHERGISQKNLELQKEKLNEIRDKAWAERTRLLPKQKIDLTAYKNLDMGQLRVERIIDNNVFVSRAFWNHGQKNMALKNMALLAGDKIVYKKAAGKIRRRVKK